MNWWDTLWRSIFVVSVSLLGLWLVGALKTVG